MQPPNLADFDIYHVGISGGKDSTDLALWAWYESGLPREKIRVTFCDTENEDPLTYAFIDLLRDHFPVHVVKPEMGFYDLARHKQRFPATRSRFCTQYLKIIPTREDVMELRRQGYEVVRFSGVRHAEGHSSNDRGSAPLWELHDGDFTWVHRPILHHTIEQVWEMHRKYLSLGKVIGIVEADPTMPPERKAQIAERLRADGTPCNPLYVIGATRVGCYPCINSRKAELRALAKYRPERIDFIEEKERWVGEVTSAGISTFFKRGTIPLHLNSHTITAKDGRVLTVPTVRDVVNWTQTARGGRQYDMDFTDDDLPLVSACDIGGMCE